MLIRKVTISNGVYWVDVPGANLRILCAAPEDAVKHLIRRGFIHDLEEDGIAYESGPNAILLADTSTQNGQFTNLAEFPVLQMLYRQGMIIPDHPGNIGVKPLLIGSETQVRAQLNYIFRGNYGLVSEKELIEAGVTPGDARDLMRLKLKFAFGEIKSPREILDTAIVEEDITQVRNSVFVSRLASNVFEISYGGESVEVDLNLPALENYAPPYHLGYHALEQEYFAVVHSGDGDGWDSNRPSMSSIVMFQGRIFLIDAGPNIANALSSLGIGITEVEGVFLTHAHDDHFSGIPTLMQSGRPVKFFSTGTVRASALKKMSALLSMNENDFASYLDFCDLKMGEWNDIEGLEVMPVFSPHPVENTCMVFRALSEEGYKTYAHMADIVSMKVLQGMVTDDHTEPGLSRELFDQVRESYLRPADIKKIDVGGGMIHGEAADFAADSSSKIVLAHRATPLTQEERRIGAGAPFGTVDVLIHGSQTYTYQKAARLLRTYYQELDPHIMQSLLNGAIIEYNPESFLGRTGDTVDSPLLLLRGQVERLEGDGSGQSRMSSGTIIGELSSIDNTPLQDTYRAISFVTALRIPAQPFRHFIATHGLAEEIRQRRPVREFLQETNVLNDNVSRRLMIELADAASVVTLKDGETLDWTAGDALYVIESGAVNLMLGGKVHETLNSRESFAETFVLFGVEPVYGAVAKGEARLLRLSADQVGKIPVARWKLQECYQRRIHNMIINASSLGDEFEWLDEFATGIDEMDEQHRNLFRLANLVLALLKSDAPQSEILRAFEALVAASKGHFNSEEELLAKVTYPKLAMHTHTHAELLLSIRELGARIFDSSGVDETEGRKDGVTAQEFRSFFLSWILFHTLGEDRKYARFMLG